MHYYEMAFLKNSKERTMHTTKARTLKTITYLLSSLALTPAYAATIKDGGYVGCVTEEQLTQFVNALVKDDNRAVQHMLQQKSCFILNSSFSITVLKMTASKANIRVYFNNGAIELWTPSEAIQR